MIYIHHLAINEPFIHDLHQPPVAAPIATLPGLGPLGEAAPLHVALLAADGPAPAAAPNAAAARRLRWKGRQQGVVAGGVGRTGLDQAAMDDWFRDELISY